MLINFRFVTVTTCELVSSMLTMDTDCKDTASHIRALQLL